METHDGLYKPISTTEFRVVHLLPGTFDDEIQCALETRSSGIKTRYEALSYQWGDDSVTKPIRIAHLEPPSRQQTTSLRTIAWPFSSIKKAVGTLQTVVEQYVLARLLSWCIGTYCIWSFVSPLPLEPGPWIAWMGVPPKPYLFLVCMICGSAPFDLVIRACKLLAEVAQTKPWTLAYHFRLTGREQLEFNTVQVPTNLGLALRYLRLEKRSRTLWIDALCINQTDEDEKRMQIQRMDWVYANASAVVVWLGGYHGITEAADCEEHGECVHRRQIKAAFDLFWSPSGWRVFIPGYFLPDREYQYREARLGFRDLYGRGWWERLWVIQEVALATGQVKIQCGHNTCLFDDFSSAQHTISRRLSGNKELKEGSESVDRLTTTIKDFRHSYHHDLEGPSGKSLSRAIRKVITFSGGQDIDNYEARFYDQPFADRLQRILLKTAGQFRCRDDRDRLFAVLGIAGGAKSQITMTADLVRYISSFSTVMIVGRSMDSILETPISLPEKLAIQGFCLAHSFWACFYDSSARYWTVNRPKYVVTGYKEVIDAVTVEQGERPSRVEFFTALARYLADKTKTLAFLDAATCGEDKDDGMPSWVPNWTREVGSPAYNFSIRVKTDQALDSFKFSDDGKALIILGQPKGTVHVVRSVTDPELPQPHRVQALFENWLSLPSAGKKAAEETLKLSLVAAAEMSAPEQGEAKQKLISLCSRMIKKLLDMGQIFLKHGGPILVYSFDKEAREMGFLKAGEAAKGDRIVFVPGSFHHLVLRRQGEVTGADMRWKLVGLVAMGTSLKVKAACSESDWAQLRKDGQVFKYTIV